MKYIAEQLGNSLAICERHYAHVVPDHRAEVFANLPALNLSVFISLCCGGGDGGVLVAGLE